MLSSLVLRTFRKKTKRSRVDVTRLEVFVNERSDSSDPKILCCYWFNVCQRCVNVKHSAAGGTRVMSQSNAEIPLLWCEVDKTKHKLPFSHQKRDSQQHRRCQGTFNQLISARRRSINSPYNNHEGNTANYTPINGLQRQFLLVEESSASSLRQSS